MRDCPETPECDGCSVCTRDLNDDVSYYTTLKLPNYPLMHEADSTCWCDPHVLYDDDGYPIFIHQSPN